MIDESFREIHNANETVQKKDIQTYQAYSNNYQIDNHCKAYFKNKERFHKQAEDAYEIDKIKEYLANNQIECDKYNYALDEGIQNYKCYNGYIQLSKDFKYINIVNRKPNDTVKYILEADPDQL